MYNKQKKIFNKVAKVQQKMVQQSQSNFENVTLQQVDRMDGVQFEQFLGLLLSRMGYQAEMTKTSGDFGCDLFVRQGNKRIVVQAKRYSKTVGVSAVQEIVSSKPMYNATEAWVITNAKFTKAAMTLAQANGVYLYDRTALAGLINRYF